MITQPELLQVIRMRPLELAYNVPRIVQGARYRIWRVRPEGMDVDDANYYPFNRTYDTYVKPEELADARKKVEVQITMMLADSRHQVQSSELIRASDVFVRKLEKPYWVVAVDRFQEIYMYRCDTAAEIRGHTTILGLDRLSPCTSGHFSPGRFVEDQVAFDTLACHPVRFSKPSYYDNNF